jgi:hypothetical protein
MTLREERLVKAIEAVLSLSRDGVSRTYWATLLEEALIEYRESLEVSE